VAAAGGGLLQKRQVYALVVCHTAVTSAAVHWHPAARRPKRDAAEPAADREPLVARRLVAAVAARTLLGAILGGRCSCS
jgi:hypothetical protein